MSNLDSHHVPAQPAPAIETRPAEMGDTVDCWRRIGVEGDASCSELEKFVHCRNCPVYSNAALQLLNRPLPGDYRREWSEHFAQKKESAAAAKISAVVFRVGPEWLALPTQAFQEVVERRPIHSIPHRRQGIVIGLVNIRGELLVCVALGKLLGLEQTFAADPMAPIGGRLLVVIWDGHRLVFPADEVHGTRRLRPEELSEPPATVSRAAATFTHGLFSWDGKMVGLLEPESLFATLNRSLS